MRLLETTSLDLQEFSDEIPQFAVLSQTWGKDEVSYQEMIRPTLESRSKAGYSKTRKSAYIARKNNFAYIEWDKKFG